MTQSESLEDHKKHLEMQTLQLTLLQESLTDYANDIRHFKETLIELSNELQKLKVISQSGLEQFSKLKEIYSQNPSHDNYENVERVYQECIQHLHRFKDIEDQFLASYNQRVV
jgi:hypothetical protein